MTRLRHLATVAAIVTGLCISPAGAGPLQIQWVPDGLNPGQQYYLVFVTSTTRDGTSTDIADYNAFVDGVGDTIPGHPDETWKCIASTASTSAKQNLALQGGIPIYRLDGERVADSAADLWDGSIQAPLMITELGTEKSGTPADQVWTGTDSSGEPLAGQTLGTSLPRLGRTTSTDYWWVDCTATSGSHSRSMYAVSGPHVVPGGSTVPTLGGYGLIVLVLALAGVASRRVVRAGRR